MSKVGGQSDIDRVREATDLVRLIGESVPLRPRGREHIGLCPFHDDRTPSMAVVTHKGNAFYKCHACGEGGDCFEFVMKYHRMDFGEALRFLAQKAGIALTPWKRDEADEQAGPRRIDVKKANAFAATFFRRMLSDETAGAAARGVIAARGISDEMVEAFGLGAAPDAWDGLLNRIRRQSLPVEPFVSAGLLKLRREGAAGAGGAGGAGGGGQYDAFRNRLMFPICDELGNAIAFGARKIKAEDEPKYLNSSESALFNKSKTLYGLNLAKRAIIERHTAIVTEGYTDVIACHQAGVTNAVATLGTALTREHARLLSRLCDTVILLFDGDEAGMKAADRALEVFFSETVDIKICVLPDGCDPDELLKQAGGRERFDAALAASIDALQYKIERFQDALAAPRDTSMSGRQKRLEAFLQELAQVGFASLQGVRKQMVLTRLGELMRLPVNVIEQALAKHGGTDRRSAPGMRDAAGLRPVEAPAAEVDDEPTVSRTRRLAEFDLLGLVVFEPALALQLLDEIVADIGGAEGALAIERYRHPASRAVAGFIAQHAAGQRPFTVQQLLGAIDDERHRSVASRLYFDGQRLAGDDAANLDAALRSAWAALDRCDRHEHLQEAVELGTGASSDPLERAREIVNSRRQAGHIASAIGRGVRG